VWWCFGFCGVFLLGGGGGGGGGGGERDWFLPPSLKKNRTLGSPQLIDISQAVV